LGADEPARGVGLEQRDGLLDARAVPDLARDAGLLLGHARELLDAPLVGLIEVDDGAEEPARLERVVLAADAVPLAGGRERLALEELRELRVSGRGRLGASREVGAQRLRQLAAVVGRRAGREVEEEAVGGRVPTSLDGDLARLALGRHDAVADARAQ